MSATGNKITMTKEEKFTETKQGGPMKPGESCSSPDKPTPNSPNYPSEPTKTDVPKAPETQK